MPKNRNKQSNFLTALTLVIITIVLIGAIYAQLFIFPVQLVWIGALFIAFFTPIYHELKKSYPAKIKPLLHFHVYGNIIAAMLVLLHCAQIIIQPRPYSTFLTGILLDAIMILLLSTGFLLRFQPYLRKLWRNMHIGVTIAFYVVLVLHVIVSHQNILHHFSHFLAMLTAAV